MKGVDGPEEREVNREEKGKVREEEDGRREQG